MNTQIDIEDLNPDLLSRISNDLAWMYRSIPFEFQGDSLLILSDCEDLEKLKTELEVLLNISVSLQKADPKLIDKALEKHYRKSSSIKLKDTGFSNDFVENLILESKSLNSSDVHIENGEQNARVRMRIDGKLIERYQLDKATFPELINKIKIKSGLDISEKRLPQDGRFQVAVNEIALDVRVSTTPTILGEKVVMRLLNKESKNLDLDHIGMTDFQREIFRNALKSQNGIILISGPTGSGKTSTLYSALKELNNGENNILTIEDPVEYTMTGVYQVQLKENIGLDFAKALKAFLRQDPDIIMVGEIRDQATANMAIRAALTGHLVFSTIHTNSAWSTISRLIDMGIPSYLIAGTLRISLAQRLVRTLCNDCKIPDDSSFKSLSAKQAKSLREKIIYRSKGCSNCFHTGYLGRKAIFEIIEIDQHLQTEIRKENYEEHEILSSYKVSTLADEAIALVRSGQTSVEEVFPLIMAQSN